MKTKNLKALLDNYGKRYSEILGIDLTRAEEDEVFKWFLASVLFGAPITETSVIKTYRCFQKYDILTPKRILRTGWDGLVKILDEGTYTRYDFKTADKLLATMKKLLEEYRGSLNLLHQKALDSKDLETRLKALGKGIGDVTVSIFLRELRDTWEKADPAPTDLVLLAAKELGITEKKATPEEALRRLKSFWSENKVDDESFVNFETALFRIGKDLRKKKRVHSLI